MESIGLLSHPFEDSIYPFSLKFKNPALEEAFVEAQTSMKFVSKSTRNFLIFILAGHVTVHIIDVAEAMGVTPDYKFSLETWIIYGFLPIVMILEGIFYRYDSLAVARGIPMTIIGSFALFHNNFDIFVNDVFYPFTGTE